MPTQPTPISDHTVPWPDHAVREYVAKGYWAGVPLGTLLREVADRHPDVPALVDPAAGVRLTHGELAERADAAAARLLDLGMSRGDRVVVQLGNGWEFVVLTVACLRAGIVPVMALPAHRRTELAYLARHAEATAIAVPDRMREFDHQALAHELADDVRAVTGGPWHVLVAGNDLGPGSVDLRALCGPGEEPARRPRAVRRRGARQPRRRGLPAVRRHHRPAQADRPHPRRLRLQRPPQRRDGRHRPPTRCTW